MLTATLLIVTGAFVGFVLAVATVLWIDRHVGPMF